MIEIGINPNTKQASVAITMHGYFGLNRDGIKLVDQDTVFEARTVAKAGEIPSNAFDTCQKPQQNTGEILENKTKAGQFKSGNEWRGNDKGRPLGSKNKTKTPLADLLKVVAEQKHYTIKDTGEKVVAYDLIAEMVIDEIITRKSHKMLETFLDRTEGKVTQGVKLSGAVAQGNLPEETLQKLDKLFN